MRLPENFLNLLENKTQTNSFRFLNLIRHVVKNGLQPLKSPEWITKTNSLFKLPSIDTYRRLIRVTEISRAANFCDADNIQHQRFSLHDGVGRRLRKLGFGGGQSALEFCLCQGVSSLMSRLDYLVGATLSCTGSLFSISSHSRLTARFPKSC